MPAAVVLFALPARGVAEADVGLDPAIAGFVFGFAVGVAGFVFGFAVGVGFAGDAGFEIDG